MNTSDRNASSDSPPSAVFSAASLYGTLFQGLKLNRKNVKHYPQQHPVGNL